MNICICSVAQSAYYVKEMLRLGLGMPLNYEES